MHIFLIHFTIVLPNRQPKNSSRLFYFHLWFLHPASVAIGSVSASGEKEVVYDDFIKRVYYISCRSDWQNPLVSVPWPFTQCVARAFWCFFDLLDTDIEQAADCSISFYPRFTPRSYLDDRIQSSADAVQNITSAPSFFFPVGMRYQPGFYALFPPIFLWTWALLPLPESSQASARPVSPPAIGTAASESSYKSSSSWSEMPWCHRRSAIPGRGSGNSFDYISTSTTIDMIILLIV